MVCRSLGRDASGIWNALVSYMKRRFLFIAFVGISAAAVALFVSTDGDDEPAVTERLWEPAKVRLGKRNPPKMPAPGLWSKAETSALTEELEAMEAIGYVGGTEEASSEGGVTINDPRATTGLNFYVSGHDAMAISCAPE